MVVSMICISIILGKLCGAIALLVFQEGVVDAHGNGVLPVGSIQVFLLVGCGDESQFDEATRHRRLSQHEEPSLVDTLVHPTADRAHLALYEFGQIHAIGHVLVLHEFEHDVAFGRIRVESGIPLLVVFLDKDHRVLAFGHIEVVVGPVHTQCIGLESA